MTQVTREDIEAYLQGFVGVERDFEDNRAYEDKGWRWCIDESGTCGEGRIARNKDGTLMFSRPYRTELGAHKAGMAYLWKERPDLVAIARNDAYESARYREREQAQHRTT